MPYNRFRFKIGTFCSEQARVPRHTNSFGPKLCAHFPVSQNTDGIYIHTDSGLLLLTFVCRLLCNILYCIYGID